MAGGVALNCVANGKIIKEGIFEDIWIQPAAGDAGGALGAALLTSQLKNPKKMLKNNKNDFLAGSLLGPSFSNSEIFNSLKKVGAKAKKFDNRILIKKTVEAISNDNVVGWFQGKMEFGPRALGNRPIIANPRSEKMQKNLNLKIKYRESFRPFAPAILKEKLGTWFKAKIKSPYMLIVFAIEDKKLFKKNLKKKFFGLQKLYEKRSVIPAVTHVDNTARVQTVDKNINPLFYNLINAFYKKTKCPILINTSFNIRSEPIVCTPEDAFKCFMGTEMDLLVIGNYLLYKKDQDKKLIKDYRIEFVLD